MVKRASRENARDRKCSEDMTDNDLRSPKKKSKYNLRNRNKNKKEGTLWIDDDTLETDDESYVSEIDSEAMPPINITLFIAQNKEEEESEEESEEEEEYVPEKEEVGDFLNYLEKKYVTGNEPKDPPIFQQKKTKPKKEDKLKIPISLTRDETAYFKKQPHAKQRELVELMNKVATLSLNEGEEPNKFKVLKLPISDYMKSNVIKKMNALADMGNDNGESYKLRTWLDAFFRIPFGKSVPLPVKIEDGREKCTDFMVNARKTMDSEIYGMVPAKTQIMQVIAQWIVNPESVGNVIALQGPMGVGKTSFARNAIAKVLKRPFEFFSLGGSSDISNFVGHSYTYEGSMWGRIADCLMHAGTMNPVMYFDELDKVSTTPQGEEIVNMMIHLTDRSQNTHFHDRYFSGVDFDVSQCLFVFSFNDIDKVHPILRDRMTIIHCDGYKDTDKKIIMKNHIWPQVINRLRFNASEIDFKDEAIEYIIAEYSETEKGVRNLIRTVETMMTRLNMLRVSNHETMKEYGFYMDFTNPFVITTEVIKKLLFDFDKKEVESWKTMYT
jgi:ATP-dependent Lon protease